MFKVCKICGESKPLEMYHKHGQTRDGLCPYCKKCNIERVCEYRSKNKDIVAENRRAFHIANRDLLNEKSRAYYATNKERLNEKSRAYYAANKEHLDEVGRIYRETNREYIAERQRNYCKNNPLFVWHLNKKAGAKRDKILFDISFEQLKDRWTGCCEHTGKEFDMFSNGPLSATFDRVYPELGYTIRNVRIVTRSVNSSRKSKPLTPTELSVHQMYVTREFAC